MWKWENKCCSGTSFGLTFSNHHPPSSASFFFLHLPAFLSVLPMTPVLHYCTHSRTFSSPVYDFYRAARRKSLDQDLLCQCVCAHACAPECEWVISDCAFFAAEAIEFALEDTAAALRGSWLPSQVCVEVITVLYWKEAVQQWGLGTGRTMNSWTLLL